MRRTTEACVKAALVIMGVIAPTLLIELGMQFVGYTVKPNFDGLDYFPRFYHKADPVNGHDIAEKFSGGSFYYPDITRSYGASIPVSSNSVGCRDRPFDGENNYVLLLGDSLTWGFVPLEHTWGTTLENHLGIRVLKCGVIGYGPRQERHKLETVVKQAGRPRLVIVGYFVGNDLFDDYVYPNNTVINGYVIRKVILANTKRGDRQVRSDDELQAQLSSVLEQKPAGLPDIVKTALAEHSVLYNHLRKNKGLRSLVARVGLAKPSSSKEVVSVFHTDTTHPWLRQAWEDHLENLRQLKLATETVGAAFFVVIIPSHKQVYEFLRSKKQESLDWEYPNKRLAEYFQREGILFLDLLPEFRRYARHGWRPSLDAQDLYWPYNDHLNIKGNRLSGLLIGRDLLEGSFLEVHDKNTRLSNIRQLLSKEADSTDGTSVHSNDRERLSRG